MQLILVVGLFFGLLWKGYHLLRAPHDRALRVLVLCLVFLTIGNAMGLRALTRAANVAVGPGIVKVVLNIFVLLGLYLLMCFFLYAATGRVGSRRARWEAVPLVVALVIVTVTMLATPVAYRAHTLTTAMMSLTPIALFYLVSELYIVYALAMAARWALRYVQMVERNRAIGLRLMATGLLGLAATSGVRVAYILIRHTGGSWPRPITMINWHLSTAAELTVVAGICYPAVVAGCLALERWRYHRRAYHELGPLWTLVQEAYPQYTLDRAPTSLWWKRLGPQRVHRRFYRRVIECRDGLVGISPYLAYQGDGDTGTCPPTELVQRLREILHVEPSATDRATAGAVAVKIAVPAQDDLDSDVRALVALSRALHEHSSPAQCTPGKE